MIYIVNDNLPPNLRLKISSYSSVAVTVELFYYLFSTINISNNNQNGFSSYLDQKGNLIVYSNTTGDYVVVSCAEVPYAMLFYSAGIQEFIINKIRAAFTFDAQIDNSLTFKTQDFKGRVKRDQFSFRQFFNPNNPQPLLIDVPFEFNIDSNSGLELLIEPCTINSNVNLINLNDTLWQFSGMAPNWFTPGNSLGEATINKVINNINNNLSVTITHNLSIPHGNNLVEIVLTFQNHGSVSYVTTHAGTSTFIIPYLKIWGALTNIIVLVITDGPNTCTISQLDVVSDQVNIINNFTMNIELKAFTKQSLLSHSYEYPIIEIDEQLNNL